MKQSLRLVLVSLGLLAAPFALQAKSPEQAYVASFSGRADIPVPISVVTPELSPRYAGTTVQVAFIVNAEGRPTEITTTGSSDAALVNKIVSAVAQWRFAPVQQDGVAVSSKVVVPFRIVDPLPGRQLAMK